MVFIKKLMSLIFSFNILRPQPPRIKQDTSYDQVVALDVPEKLESVPESPTRLSSSELCCVCLSGLEEEEEEMRVLPCLHKFHRVCVNRWFNVCRKTCPVCRFSMGEEEKFQQTEELTEEMVIWFSSFHAAGF